MERRKRYEYEDVPVPRRSRYRYRRRREAQIAAQIQNNAQQGQNTDSDIESEHSAHEENAEIREEGPHSPVSFHSDHSLHRDSSQEISSPAASESEVDSDQPVVQEESDAQSVSSNRSDNSDRNDDVVGEDGNRGFGPLPPFGPEPPANDNGNGRPLLNDPLCPCTATTEGDALLMCIALGIRHGLSWTAIVDILKMINKLFGKKVILSSKYYLLKYFDVSKNSTTVHIYCPECESYLGTKERVVDEQVLQCETCAKQVQPYSKSSSYFVSVNMNDQFKQLMETPALANEIMTYRFERRKVNENAFEDIYDGRRYKNLSEGDQPLSNPLNFSVTMNTDGLALGRSSAQSAWPLFLHVNELSPVNRKKHLIYAGMWVGKKQPSMRIFLRQFVDNLRDLSHAGFNWVDVNGAEQTSRVIPILAVLDSGARYKFLNLTAFSGYWGCTFCYQKAVNTIRGRRFPFVEEAAPLRTQASMVEDMQIAHANRDHRNEKMRVHRGCRGFTPLILLSPYLDLGAGVVVDYMHNALLGVTRSHIYALLNTANTPYYIGDPDSMFIIDERLKKIRPPRSITRTPRELKEIKIFTASEWRALLLFYGIICFDGVLSKKYLVHFSLLSSAFYILLQNSIPDEEMQRARTYIKQYISLTQQYFGLTSMKYNFHLLLHVIQSVEDWGPIWAYSTFVFEGENHYLAKMHTSAGRVAIQLTRRYLMFKSYPQLCETFASSDEPLIFASEITGKTFASYIRCGQTVMMGKGERHHLCAEHLQCVNQMLGQMYVNAEFLSYSRMLHRKVRFTTQQYSVGKKNDDSWIKFRNGKRGFINNIYYLHTEDTEKVIVIVREVKIDPQPVLRTELVVVTHIKRIMNVGELLAIEPHEILGQCIHMEVDNGNFIVDMPYGCYGD